MSRIPVLAIAVSLLAVTHSTGQEFQKPGSEHEKLKAYVGDWDAVMTMGEQKTKAKSTYKAICGGMWVASDFEGQIGENKFQGHGLDGYDLKRKKYMTVWVDSMESAPMHFEGDYDSTGKTLVMTGQSIGRDGMMQKFKTTTTMPDNDHFTFKMFMVQTGAEDQLSFTIEYTRRK